MAALNYATEYSQALAQAFPYVLNFGDLYATPNNGRYRVKDAKTIEIPVLSTTGRVAGSRDTISSAARNFDNSWETKTLTNHRKWGTLVHPQDINQTNQVASIQNITQTFNEEQKFPEMDAYTISKIYADFIAAGGVADTTGLTVDNVLTVFDTLMQAMDEARVPQQGRILYITPAVNTLIKNAKAMVRNVNLQDGNTELTRIVSSIDMVKLVVVPPTLMLTAYDFTTGWVAGAGAKQINMALIHPLAVITPSSYTFAQLEEPSALSEGKYVYFEEAFEDVFILNNKKAAIAFNRAV